MRLPAYDELPPAERGGKSAWGLFGQDDSVGLMNLITPDVTRAAAQLIQTGTIIPLDAPLDLIDPPLFERSPLEIDTITLRGGRSLDEVYNGFNPQASSQWDSLGHFGYDVDCFYNGVTIDEIRAGNINTINFWAQRGIATRGVLLDLKRTALTDYAPNSSYAFTVDDLERARRSAGTSFQTGDILVLRTGYLEWYKKASPEERVRISSRTALSACGIEHTEDMARYLWNSGAVAVVSDCPSLEVWPMDWDESNFPFGVLHRILLGQFGMGIGELWDLDALSDWCAENKRNTFFLTSAPLNSARGVGSPANALAIL